MVPPVPDFLRPRERPLDSYQKGEVVFPLPGSADGPIDLTEELENIPANQQEYWREHDAAC